MVAPLPCTFPANVPHESPYRLCFIDACYHLLPVTCSHHAFIVRTVCNVAPYSETPATRLLPYVLVVVLLFALFPSLARLLSTKGSLLLLVPCRNIAISPFACTRYATPYLYLTTAYFLPFISLCSSLYTQPPSPPGFQSHHRTASCHALLLRVPPGVPTTHRIKRT